MSNCISSTTAIRTLVDLPTARAPRRPATFRAEGSMPIARSTPIFIQLLSE